MQKIDLNKRNSFGTLDWLEHWNEPGSAKLIESKINELVDAVNILQAQAAILQEHAHPTATTEQEKIAQGFKNLQDPYAEQRKWIGKLCKFWDDPDDYSFDKLKEITPDGCYIKEGGNWYLYCEPVKPDDNIIYKGEDNE